VTGIQQIDVNVRPITDDEFTRFRDFIYEHAGIALSPQKRQLVAGRLLKRVKHHGHGTYGDYFAYVMSSADPGETQMMVDCLTTNETYFFREPAHFDFLKRQILPAHRGRSFRVWSAACSSGEEVYTLAMVLAEQLGQGDWEVLGTDISRRVLDTARTGLYPMMRTSGIPGPLLSEYCLKGVRSHEGYLLIDPRLKQRVRFEPANLKTRIRDDSRFDVIFLRNVLIYFDLPTKQQVIDNVTARLKPGGHFFISHVESLQGIHHDMRQVGPSIFRSSPDGRR
jgi:chemotaxis protein methyltransferase CheR